MSLCRALLLTLYAVAPAGATGQQDILPLILQRLRAIEVATRTLAVSVAIEVLEVDGVELTPVGRTAVRWRMRGGRSVIEIDGIDLDYGLRAGGLERATRRVRLHLPGGITESLDLRSGHVSRDQRSYVDAASLSSDTGIGEFFWSFCGSYRSSILDARGAVVSRVRTLGSGRVIELIADDPTATQRIVFECAEEWGFLPATLRMLVRHSGEWTELRKIEIHAARLTKLGYMPESASLTALRPPPDGSGGPESFRKLRARYAFSEPELVDVRVPTGISALAVETRPVQSNGSGVASPFDQDPLLASSSALFREPITTRGHDLDRFLTPLKKLRTTPSGPGGQPRSWRLLGAMGLAVALLVGAAGIRMSHRALMAGGTAGVVLATAGLGTLVILDLRAGSTEAYAAITSMEVIAADALPRSKTLCGVDCLYAAAALSRRPPLEYSTVLRLVRPGTHGTTLAVLQTVSECLDLFPRIINPRSFEVPPDPLIAHVEPSHFVVVTPLNDGSVAVVDPGRGISRARWAQLKEMLSPVALAFERIDPS